MRTSQGGELVVQGALEKAAQSPAESDQVDAYPFGFGRGSGLWGPREALRDVLEEGQQLRHELWFSGNPIPKGRPRWANGGFHTPEATREWEETVSWQCRDQWERAPLLGPLGIELIFYRENKIRCDLDNLEKALLDGLQGILFQDDSQIKVKRSELHQGCGRPGVEVTIWEIA